MSDYMKDGPATPGQAPQMAQPNQKSSAAPIVVTLLIVFVGLPIIGVIAVFIFVGANFDKIADWADRHVSYSNGSAVSNVDEERLATFSKIYAETKNDSLRTSVGLTKNDCRNVIAQLQSLEPDFGADDFCDVSQLRISSEEEENFVTDIYIQNGKECISLSFWNNLNYIDGYRYSTSASKCKDVKVVDLTDDGKTFVPIDNSKKSKKSDDDDGKIRVQINS